MRLYEEKASIINNCIFLTIHTIARISCLFPVKLCMEFLKFRQAKLHAMNLNRSGIVLLLLSQTLFASPASAQSIFDLCFRGKLADIEGKEISAEHFDLKVQINRVAANEVFYEFKTASYSDKGGWFGFTIPKLSTYLLVEEQISQPVEIKIEILPNKDTEWLKDGEDFMVTYTLTPPLDSSFNQSVMSRMEGSVLEVHSEAHLQAFKDLDPFAYLLGGFLLTDEPPISDQSQLDLQRWLSPESDEDEGGASRGVKGGFPSGGYYKKK